MRTKMLPDLDVAVRTACYARFSSDQQRDTSIDDQVRECREYAKRHGWAWQPGHVYTDRAISGASIEGRTGLQALQAAAVASPRPFDVLLVDDSSRVARDLADALRVLQALKFAGVRVIYISQNIDSASEQAETLVAVHGLVDSLYLREMASKIKRGLRGQAERGYATGSVTYGYRSIPEPDPNRPGEFLGFRLEIDEAEAATIQKVFDWYAAGITLPEILKSLRAGNYPPPRGPRAAGEWERGAVVRLLQNERYTGKAIWGQRRHERKPGSRKRVARITPRSEWVVMDRPHLRIVADDLWQRAQARRVATAEQNNKRRHSGNLVSGRVGAAHGRGVLTGLMTCGICGGSISIVSSRVVNGVTYSYYGCYDAHRNGVAGCKNRVTARVKSAEEALLSGIESELKRPDTFERLLAALQAEAHRRSDHSPAQREKLGKKRDGVAKKVRRLVAAIEDGEASAALAGQLQAREAELAEVENEIAAFGAASRRKLRIDPSVVKKHLSDWADLLRGDIPKVKAHLLNLGVSLVTTPVYDVKAGERPYLRAEGQGDLGGRMFSAHDLLHLLSARRTAPLRPARSLCALLASPR